MPLSAEVHLRRYETRQRTSINRRFVVRAEINDAGGPLVHQGTGFHHSGGASLGAERRRKKRTYERKETVIVDVSQPRCELANVHKEQPRPFCGAAPAPSVRDSKAGLGAM
ncbi:hypothetical protein EYF80_048241 [Liparis tanakae]|uniref:Uncharacterized protein n=1 Tax=Liparis tanakae TaxID=230148 RepID=A0A4Z2FKD9_9TELE|nr:hypothetical protein EYF80_048241 [Liparis tanakae]